MTTQTTHDQAARQHLHHSQFNAGLTQLVLQQTQARLAALQTRLAAQK